MPRKKSFSYSQIKAVSYIKDNKCYAIFVEDIYKLIAPHHFELTLERLRQFLVDEQHPYGTAQTKLCFAKIRRIYKRCFIYELGVVKVCEYKQMVVEGNHRFIAYKLAGIDFEIRPHTSSHCDVLKKYNEVYISEDDWDANHEDTEKYCDDNYVDKNWIKKE